MLETCVLIKGFLKIEWCLFIGAGRGGRKNLSGKRNRVIVYILYNASDIAGNVPGLSAEVKEFCTTTDCLKESLQNRNWSTCFQACYNINFQKNYVMCKV